MTPTMNTTLPKRRTYLRDLIRVIPIASLTLLLLLLNGASNLDVIQAGVNVVPTKGNLYVLSIGINTYPGISGNHNLTLAVPDAQGVAGAFSTKDARNAFASVETTTLVESTATLAGVRSALEHLVKVCKPEDVVIFYFAGNGLRAPAKSAPDSAIKAPSDYDFVLYDSFRNGEDNTTITNFLSARELSLLLLSIQAQRQLVILDSSRSSVAFDSLSAALNADSVFKLRDSGRRFALFGIEGEGLEYPDLGHGLMTYTLLQAMQGAADPNHLGYITESALEGYMMTHTADMSIVSKADGKSYQLEGEMLLSYSDLRGLCLSNSGNSSSCNTAYGYDPSVKSVEETRGFPSTRPSPAQQALARGTDYAVILAGDTYEHWPSLQNPIYDAKTLQQELIENYGYSKENIFYRENPTKRDIHDLLTELQHRAFQKNDRLLIYVAGHGFMEDSGEGFIVTHETALPAIDPYLDSGLDLSRFRSTIDGLPVPHILLVLDVCYGGSFKDHKTMPEYTSANLDTPPTQASLIENKMKSVSRLYIASGGLRQAFDGAPGKHSPFARTFLKTLQQYGGPDHIIDMGKLDGAVYGLCPHPYYGSFGVQQEGGDFLFIPKPGAQPVPDPGLQAKVDAPPCSP
jgi:uncharacterized caspase-like protein